MSERNDKSKDQVNQLVTALNPVFRPVGSEEHFTTPQGKNASSDLQSKHLSLVFRKRRK